ncbi:MAG TPA: hypothetical protein VE986_00355 [Hyphomicrobiales bacterium]|nr:hypothetical protein [Hyphomicrobiales bacterium]
MCLWECSVKRSRPPKYGGGAFRTIEFAAFGILACLFAIDPQELAAASSNKGPILAAETVREQTILPQMELGEALEAFERNYHTPEFARRFSELNLKSAQNLIKDFSVLSGKLFAAAMKSQNGVSLRPGLFPVPTSPQKRRHWIHVLARGVQPPEISHQTFAVSLGANAYIIAPAHGVRGEKRYLTPPNSDTAVRSATADEAKYAIPLERRPSALPARIATLEGKLPTGEIVRFETPVVRGFEPLQLLLPDSTPSFYNSKRGVHVPYERTEIFILPPEWSRPNRLRLHRAVGFSGAPAIENTPEGDAIVGQFMGYRSIKIGNERLTLGILADHDAIRFAVEKYAAEHPQ